MLKEYKEFVDTMASDAGKDYIVFKERLNELHKSGIKVNRIELAIAGLCGETGEVADLWKKVIFHRKDFDRDEFIKEMGDVIWYWTLLSISLDIDAEEVMKKNIEKIEKRYPGRKFKHVDERE